MILVTGATGNIGGEVVRLLSSKGEQVRALVRDIKKAQGLAKIGVELAQGDFDDPASLDAALADVKSAFLLSPSMPQQVELQGNFVEAAKRANVRHIVKLSGAGASEHNLQQFARWHWQVEQHIRSSGVPFTFVQPIYFMQNFLGKDTAQMIATQGRFAAPIDPDLKFNVVDSRDISAVIASVLSTQGHEGKTYIVTGPELLSSNEHAEKFSAALGKHVSFVNVPAEAFKNILLSAGQPQWLAESVVELFENLDTYVTHTIAEVAKKEPIPFDQFIRDNLDAFKEVS
ncbi:MAG: SDR family oxidoreductase [Ktedonobacteraceae bacterium]